MYDTAQLDELLELWDCLDNGQREGLLRLLRAIIEESPDEDADTPEDGEQPDQVSSNYRRSRRHA